jgi:putative transcriptional regulator, helix-turn-helix XRE-family
MPSGEVEDTLIDLTRGCPTRRNRPSRRRTAPSASSCALAITSPRGKNSFHRRCSDAQEPASSHAPSARAHRPVDPHLAAAQGLTAEQVADRAGISRPTLRTIETHPERASFGNVMAVLAVLGVDEAITTAIDPLESERGRALVLARLEPGARP